MQMNFLGTCCGCSFVRSFHFISINAKCTMENDIVPELNCSNAKSKACDSCHLCQRFPCKPTKNRSVCCTHCIPGKNALE